MLALQDELDFFLLHVSGSLFIQGLLLKRIYANCEMHFKKINCVRDFIA